MANGKRLEKLRKGAGLTRREVAVQMNVTTWTVWGWEKGKAYPRAAKWPRLAKVLQCEFADVVPGMHGRRGAA